MRTSDCSTFSPGNAVGSLDGGVAEVLQHLGDEHAHRGLVVHDQDRLALPGALDLGEPARDVVLVGLAIVARQVEADRRALPNLRVEPDLTAGLAREAVNHRQAEAGAFAHRLGGEERLEHLGHEVGRHAGAGVGHADAEVLPRRHVVLAGTDLVHPPVGGLDGDAAAIRHGVARVDAEVQQGVLQLARVDQSWPDSRQAHHFQMDMRADRTADELLHVGDQAVHVRGLGVEGLAPGEGEEAVRQGSGALGRALGHRHVAVEVAHAALRHSGLHQLQRAGDAGQQVVEVVRQPTGQLPDRLHLLGLT